MAQLGSDMFTCLVCLLTSLHLFPQDFLLRKHEIENQINNKIIMCMQIALLQRVIHMTPKQIEYSQEEKSQ